MDSWARGAYTPPQSPRIGDLGLDHDTDFGTKTYFFEGNYLGGNAIDFDNSAADYADAAAAAASAFATAAPTADTQFESVSVTQFESVSDTQSEPAASFSTAAAAAAAAAADTWFEPATCFAPATGYAPADSDVMRAYTTHFETICGGTNQRMYRNLFQFMAAYLEHSTLATSHVDLDVVAAVAGVPGGGAALDRGVVLRELQQLFLLAGQCDAGTTRTTHTAASWTASSALARNIVRADDDDDDDADAGNNAASAETNLVPLDVLFSCTEALARPLCDYYAMRDRYDVLLSYADATVNAVDAHDAGGHVLTSWANPLYLVRVPEFIVHGKPGIAVCFDPETLSNVLTTSMHHVNFRNAHATRVDASARRLRDMVTVLKHEMRWARGDVQLPRVGEYYYTRHGDVKRCKAEGVKTPWYTRDNLDAHEHDAVRRMGTPKSDVRRHFTALPLATWVACVHAARYGTPPCAYVHEAVERLTRIFIYGPDAADDSNAAAADGTESVPVPTQAPMSPEQLQACVLEYEHRKLLACAQCPCAAGVCDGASATACRGEYAHVLHVVRQASTERHVAYSAASATGAATTAGAARARRTSRVASELPWDRAWRVGRVMGLYPSQGSANTPRNAVLFESARGAPVGGGSGGTDSGHYDDNGGAGSAWARAGFRRDVFVRNRILAEPRWVVHHLAAHLVMRGVGVGGHVAASGGLETRDTFLSLAEIDAFIDEQLADNAALLARATAVTLPARVRRAAQQTLAAAPPPPTEARKRKRVEFTDDSETAAAEPSRKTVAVEAIDDVYDDISDGLGD